MGKSTLPAFVSPKKMGKVLSKEESEMGILIL